MVVRRLLTLGSSVNSLDLVKTLNEQMQEREVNGAKTKSKANSFKNEITIKNSSKLETNLFWAVWPTAGACRTHGGTFL